MKATPYRNSGQAQHRSTLSPQDRERLILEHLPQVNKIARHIHKRIPKNVSLDDLISNGIIGLISAIDRFDPDRNINLKTYAGHRIPGAILDGLRCQDWASRLWRQRAKQIAAATCAAGQSLHRVPSQDEVAHELGLSMDQYHDRVAATEGLNLDSLECASLENDRRNLLRTLAGDEEQWPSHVVERRELRRVLAEEISQMPEIEGTVLRRYYYEEMTLLNISRIAGLTESRISQIKTQAIRTLRSRMEKRWPKGRGFWTRAGAPTTAQRATRGGLPEAGWRSISAGGGWPSLHQLHEEAIKILHQDRASCAGVVRHAYGFSASRQHLRATVGQPAGQNVNLVYGEDKLYRTWILHVRIEPLALAAAELRDFDGQFRTAQTTRRNGSICYSKLRKNQAKGANQRHE